MLHAFKETPVCEDSQTRWRCFVAKTVDDNVKNYNLVVYLLDDEASTRNGMHEPSVQEAA